MVITDQAQFKQLVQEVRDQILSESQGVGEVDIVDNLDNIYSLPALKLNDSGDQVVEAPLSLLSAPAEEAAALARAAAYDANTAAKSANSAASSANSATDKTNEAISNAQSATQQAESSANKANTAAQKADEATVQVLSGESERVEAENARQAAETERQSAEEERKSAEEARKLAEQSREEAEASRVSAEESRVTAESERVTAESSRAQAETERVQKESERESAESTRQQNETTRQSNEDTRVQQEQTRQTNEEQRVSAESSRETEYADLKQRADALIDDNEAAIENANTAAENANAAIANMENTYAKKDEIPDVSEFITISVDNLVNYYRKSETYNQEQVNSLIGSITTINFKIVDSLPGTGENNLIYLVPSSKQEEKNIKDEYIWVNDSWELIGSTKIDLSNYYTRDEVDSTFALKTELAWDTITGKPVWIGSSKPTYTWSEINEKPTTLAGYGITDAYTKTEIDRRYVTIGTSQTIAGTKTFTVSPWLTGGTCINIINRKESNATGLFWKNADDRTTTIGGIGMLSLDGVTPISFYMGWGTNPWNTPSNFEVNSGYIRYKGQNILHTGNYTSILDTRYVKKSGDTMNSALTILTGGLTVSSSHQNNGARLVGDAKGGWLQFGTMRSAEPENKVGTISAYGGFDLTSLNIRIANNGFTISGNKVWHAGNDGNGSGLDADLLDGFQNGYVTANKLYTNGAAGDVNAIKGNCIQQVSNSSLNAPYIYGTLFQFSNVNEPVAGKNGHWVNQLMYGTNETIYVRQRINVDSWKDWKIIAFTDSNVASATKLQTPRTIWGQSFDGTESVSGDLSSVRHINARSSSGGYDILISQAEGESLRINTRDGNNILKANGLTMLINGYIGFGTISPQYRVDVTGDIRATGNIIGTVSSDIQLKTILNTIDYQDKLLSLGDVVDYEYNEIAFDRPNSSTLQHRTYTGLIYQNVKDVLPSMAHEDQDGYGCLNYLSYDYINLIAGALQQTITKQKQLEKRISILEEENTDLKQQLSN